MIVLATVLTLICFENRTALRFAAPCAAVSITERLNIDILNDSIQRQRPCIAFLLAHFTDSDIF